MAGDNSIATIEGLLINRLTDNLPSGFTAAMVKLPNAPAIANETKFIRCTINTSSDIDELSAEGDCELNIGIFTVECFMPLGTGSKAGLTAAKTIKDLYTGWSSGDLVVNKCPVIVNGETGNWWRVSVDVYFDYQVQYS